MRVSHERNKQLGKEKKSCVETEKRVRKLYRNEAQTLKKNEYCKKF